jgi:hypothetical protein
MKLVRWTCALALAGAVLPAAGQPAQALDTKQMQDAVLASCYSNYAREKRVFDLAQGIQAANEAIAAEKDEAMAEKRRKGREDLWRRYKDLGGEGDDYADAPRLAKDPCAKMREMLAKPPAATDKQ